MADVKDMVSSEHLDHAELRRFFDGSSSDEEAAHVLAHLVTGCPECRERARAHWPPEGSERARREDAERTYGDAFELAVAAAETRLAESEAERAAAAEAVEALLALPADEQAEHAVSEERLRTVAALDRLIGVVKETGFRDPAEYVRLAQLARDLAERLSPARYGTALTNDLRARAHCHLANAYKVVGELDTAEEHFDRAEELLARGTGDLLREARMRTLRASLRAVERRFDEAEREMRRAIRIYEDLDEAHWVRRAEADLAVYLHRAGRPEEAIAMLERGLERYDAESEWRLARVAHHTLAIAHLEVGDLVRSRAHLGEAKRLHQREPREVALTRLRWVEGKLARASGDRRAAEADFAAVRDYFLEREIAHEVANVGLDLAMIYLDEGRWSELAETAAMMLEVYRSKRIAREAIAALELFREAVVGETATRKLIRELRAYLERAEANPGERFRPGE